MTRRLLIIPIFHTGAEMGSAREFLEKAGERAFGRIGWQEHRRELEKFWEKLGKALDEELGENLNGVKIYQDGQVINGPMAVKITRKSAEKGSRNHQLLLKLINHGATLMKTENFELLKEEHRLIKAMAEAKTPIEAREAALCYKRRKDDLLRERDEYIARQIDKTLNEGSVGILFIGGEHEVREKLATDIRVEGLGEIEELASKIMGRFERVKKLSESGAPTFF